MYDILFWIISALMLGCAVGVVFNRNTVHSAFLMIVSFVSLAGLFFLLQAYFLGVLQILVYAGAVVVLFLFIIMLLEVQRGTASKLKTISTVITAAVALPLIAAGLSHLTGDVPGLAQAGEAAQVPSGANLAEYGRQLFTRYLLPLQLAGLLLLVAMLGVILLSRRAPAAETPPQ
jgi:NADH-quinone oxidoreductase subunit J